MPKDTTIAIPDPDERLARPGRAWFAEMRGKHPDETRARGTTDAGDGGWFDRLSGDGDAGDCGGDAGGD